MRAKDKDDVLLLRADGILGSRLLGTVGQVDRGFIAWPNVRAAEGSLLFHCSFQQGSPIVGHACSLFNNC